MTTVATDLVAGAMVVVVVGLAIWAYLRKRSGDVLEQRLAKRRAGSRAACRASFLEGPNRIAVVLSLSDDQVVYENADLDAYLEIANLDEIEYDDETQTGRSVSGRVLRIRAHGHAFEFELDRVAARQFESLLPARRFEVAGHKQAV
ncbi:MAG TPA: hypothetical protein VLU46_00005 [Thermoanaerobaculia bacterium]|nr:hypothetical protein [Thermoanaerobaculia bacterium]